MSAERSDILRKIRAMLDRADHPNTPPEEADTARRMADEMMTKFTIEQFELEMVKPGNVREKPIVRKVQYVNKDAGYDITANFYKLFRQLAWFSGVKVGELGYYEATCVGYERDLDYLEILYTAVRMHMSNNLEPKASRDESWQDNLARFKRAGMKWDRIHLLLREVPGYPYSDKDYVNQGGRWGVALTKAYTDWCKAHGEHRVKDHPEVWRRGFLEGYIQEVVNRLHEMERLRSGYTSGKELVLANRDEELLNALWDAFPHLRPHPSDCDCDVCHRCRDPKCQRTNCVNRRTPVRSTGRTMRELRHSSEAYGAGKSAGATVDLSSGKVGGKRGEIG